MCGSGAPEDNRAWDYLNHARQFYELNAPRATEEQRKLAFDEILIAEGSDCILFRSVKFSV